VALDAETGQGKPFATYVYATQIAEVDVDDETGEVEVVRIVASHDCGTPINPMLVEGQVEGGISMGVGFALEEEILFDKFGRQLNPNLTNYIMPTSLDMPKIETRPARSARRAWANPRACPLRQPSSTPSTTPSAFAFIPCRRPPRRCTRLSRRSARTKRSGLRLGHRPEPGGPDSAFTSRTQVDLKVRL
jgi:hypothetical protein